jgi:hypothetical protein
MRPRLYYVVWGRDGYPTQIAHGTAQATRLLNGSRAYGHPFPTRLQAEEWASWWRYEHPTP